MKFAILAIFAIFAILLDVAAASKHQFETPFEKISKKGERKLQNIFGVGKLETPHGVTERKN